MQRTLRKSTMFIVLWLISDRRVWQKQGLIVLFRLELMNEVIL